MIYRDAQMSDVPAMAHLRALTSGYADSWVLRISRYMDGTHNPQQALPSRTLYVAMEGDAVAGLVAGHLTRRHGCDGELQWIDVALPYQGTGVATALLDCMTRWFVSQRAIKICVNVDPHNLRARRFYERCGARPLDAHWLVWDDIGCRLSDAASD